MATRDGGVHPSMHWAGGGGVYLSMPWAGRVYPNMHWAGGVCIPPCTGQGGDCLGVGTSAQGGCLPRGCLPGRCLPGGVCPNACWDTPSLQTESLTDRCKNITFPQLRLRTVKIDPRQGPNHHFLYRSLTGLLPWGGRVKRGGWQKVVD